MNSKFWKILTITGLVLAVLSVGTILVQRFNILERFTLIVSSFSKGIRQTQEVLIGTTQETQQEIPGLTEEDSRIFQKMVSSCFSANECVSSLENPQFVNIREASKFLNDEDLVIGVNFEYPEIEDDPVKAYPVKIMEHYEAVNDFVNEMPVVVTYSPLTMAPRVYDRLLDGKAEVFGVSQFVLNSSPVLYDFSTKSMWNQFDGKALTGEYRHRKLVPHSSVLMRWGDWVRLYPQTVVLTAPNVTELSSSFVDYSEDNRIYFPLENSDNRLRAKDIVYSLSLDQKNKLYPESELQKAFKNKDFITDIFDGKNIQITYNKQVLKVVDTETNQEVPAQQSYYFVWAAFYPNTEIFRAS